MNDEELREQLSELCMMGKLTSWEQEFAESVNDQAAAMTKRQRAHAEQIIEERS